MKDTKQQWFKDAKFGLFIHFGLYAILAGEYQGRKTENIAEWIMNDLDIPVEAYEKLAAQFNPVHFDAEMIVTKAKEWGMNYIVLTSKHHDGFALYDSAVSPYNIMHTPYGLSLIQIWGTILRLKCFYGEACSVRIWSGEGRGTRVEISIPYWDQ